MRHFHQLSAKQAALQTKHSDALWKHKTARATLSTNSYSNNSRVHWPLHYLSMQIFSGDPVDNCDFIRAFKHLVEQKTLRASTHLYYLVQHTSGPVQELMKSCLSMQEAKGYTEARRLLKEKYGQNYRVAAAHVKQLTEG